MTMDLFEAAKTAATRRESLGPGAVVLRGFAIADEAALLAALAP